MLVRCPSCNTTYKVSDEVVKGSNSPTFRCSRCRHTFEFETGHSVGNVAAAPSPITHKDRDLSFIFPPPKQEQTEPRQAPQRNIASSEDPGLALEETEKTSWSMDSSHGKQEETFSVPPVEPDSRSATGPAQPSDDVNLVFPSEKKENKPDPSIVPAREKNDNILSLDPYRAVQASTVPYFSLFGLLVLFFAAVAAIHHTRPQASEEFVKKIPWIGSSVLRNGHLKNRVVLQSLRSGYQTILGNRDVFVVTGVALNQNSEVVRDVQLAGQLYNEEGKEIEGQTMWVGNAISPKILRGMTAQDISDLQRLKPLRTFEIPPGDAVPFAIVFLKASKEVKDFSCQLLSVKGEI